VLTELRVENLGIIPELGLVLHPGLTVITGETGAGKTLIVDALDLLAGGRSDGTAVRDGASEARVEGRFVVDGEEVVLGRVVPVEGRSRAYVDGRLATAAELARLGAALVDLHGQHQHQSLLRLAEHRRTLDRFAGSALERALTDLRRARTALADLRRDSERMGGDPRARAREIDLLRYQVTEISKAEIADADEDGRLRAEEEMLADTDALRAALEATHAALGGPALDALGEAGRPAAASLHERVLALQAEIADVARDARVELDVVVADPGRLEEIRIRRSVLADLRRKYGETLADVLAYHDEAAARLDELEGHETALRAIEERRAELEADAAAAAAEVTAERKAAAPSFAARVTQRLRALALPHAEVSVRIEPTDPGDDGADAVEFLLAPNPGEAARPLARAASGGELSRTMLAVRVVLSEAPPTLVFDEVDAGIGGEAGLAVGRALAELGNRHQVLVVTHLAQVAAFADHHVVAAKTQAGGRTVARAEEVEGEARVTELARMLGGMGTSETARQHALELVEAATATSGSRSRSRRA
jgi:DNA repair protein RecN (Recombination protein N)